MELFSWQNKNALRINLRHLVYVKRGNLVLEVGLISVPYFNNLRSFYSPSIYRTRGMIKPICE